MSSQINNKRFPICTFFAIKLKRRRRNSQSRTYFCLFSTSCSPSLPSDSPTSSSRSRRPWCSRRSAPRGSPRWDCRRRRRKRRNDTAEKCEERRSKTPRSVLSWPPRSPKLARLWRVGSPTTSDLPKLGSCQSGTSFAETDILIRSDPDASSYPRHIRVVSVSH
jgi:hypothetical protein